MGKDRRNSGGKTGNDKRGARRDAAAPYGGGKAAGKTLAQTISQGKTLADVIADSAYGKATQEPRAPTLADMVAKGPVAHAVPPPSQSDLRAKLAGRKERVRGAKVEYSRKLP